MEGGTTFHFVTAGFDAALTQAKTAAGHSDVAIAGGASTVRQAFAAGAIDELVLDIVPILLGHGERLFNHVDDPGRRSGRGRPLTSRDTRPIPHR
jgi:dihydrofolate reductase